MIDLTLRCFSRARWLTVAVNRGILTQYTDAQGATQYRPNPGFAVDEIGSVVLTPAVMDGMTVITPAVIDTWYWINLRIHGQAFEQEMDETPVPGEENDTSGFRFNKSKLVKYLRNNATTINLPFMGRTVRAYQLGATTNRVQVLDPRDYAEVRVREYLGGYQA